MLDNCLVTWFSAERTRDPSGFYDFLKETFIYLFIIYLQEALSGPSESLSVTVIHQVLLSLYD